MAEAPLEPLLVELSKSLTELVADADAAGKDRAAFAQEARDAHLSTREAVGRIAGQVDALGLALTATRLELAASIAETKAALAIVGLLRNLIYAGAVVLVGLTATLMYATLTLRGVDAEAAMRAGRQFAAPATPDRGTTSEGADDADRIKPPG